MRIIGYLTSGYPSMEQSVQAAKWYVEGGCDMLEIGIPLLENREKPYLAEVMRQAYSACPDYDAHLEAISRIAGQNPGTDITILLYDRVVEVIGPRKFTDFFLRCGIRDVNSADLANEEAVALFHRNGIRIAGLINYTLNPRQFEAARIATGFIYCQAFPRAGQVLRDGIDSPDKLIAYARSYGIENEIYCGGGISTPEHARIIKQAGADGLFLGTSIIQLSHQREKIVAEIKKYSNITR